MRFLPDENVPAELGAAIAAAGHDALRLPADMRAADGSTMLAYAAAEARLLVTLDTDFGALVPAMLDATSVAGRFAVISVDGVRVRPLE